MPHVYNGVDSLQDAPLVGKGDCVELVKQYAPGLKGKFASTWRQGAKVMDTPDLKRGTAIATFVEGSIRTSRLASTPHFFSSTPVRACG